MFIRRYREGNLVVGPNRAYKMGDLGKSEELRVGHLQFLPTMGQGNRARRREKVSNAVEPLIGPPPKGLNVQTRGESRIMK